MVEVPTKGRLGPVGPSDRQEEWSWSDSVDLRSVKRRGTPDTLGSLTWNVV